MKTASLLAALLSLSTISTAWPWTESGSGLDVAQAAEGIERMLFRRDGSSSSNQPSSTASNTDKSASNTNKPTPTPNSGSSSATNSNSKTASNSKSDSKSDSKSGSETGSSTPTGTSGGNQSAATTEYDPRLPAGGVQMITPAPTSGAQFYKIGDWVTFAWNYTSLSATPTAIDILASCASAQQTYTLATNQSISGPTGMVLWDTGSYQSSASVPLLTNQYTLIIYDAQGSITELPKAGYLGVQNSFTFGMYLGQPYTALSSYNCATCSGALRMSSMERQTWAFLFAMAGITIASFTWFAGGMFCVF